MIYFGVRTAVVVIVLGACAFNVSAATFTVTAHVYMDLVHDRRPLGRIIVGLFGETAPKTVANFRHICVHGIDGMGYTNTPFHRVIDKFMIQGGDIVHGNGSGMLSIYGNYFPDENLSQNHTGAGFVGMANKGPDTNGCQFYVTTMAASWLDGKHTIFGKIIDGQGVVHKVEKVKTDTDDKPVWPVMIAACGEEPLKNTYNISDDPYDLAAWIRASALPLGMSFTILALFQVIMRKLDHYAQ